MKAKAAQLCSTFCNPMDYNSPWNFLGQNTGVGSLSCLQGILPTQRLNPGLPHCRRILYQLSHKGNDWPGILLQKTLEGEVFQKFQAVQWSTRIPLVLYLEGTWGNTCQSRAGHTKPGRHWCSLMLIQWLMDWSDKWRWRLFVELSLLDARPFKSVANGACSWDPTS